MKKSNVILQAAIASALMAMAGGAQAGTLTGATVFATEIAGPTASATVPAIKPVAVAYTFSTPGGIVINPSGIIYAYERLSGGLYAVAPTAASFALSAGITGIAVTAVAMSGDSTTVRITLTNTATVNQTIGVGGALTWTPTTGAINTVNTTLATAGGVVNLQGSIGTTNAGTAMNTGTTVPADLDGGLSNTLAIATAAEAITAAIAASSTFAVVETQKIDLTATVPGSRFTAPGATLSNANATGVLNLGSVTFTASTAAMLEDGTTAYSIARGTATTFGGTVTGSFRTGSTGLLTTDLACTTSIAAGSAGTLNTALTTITFASGTLPTTAVARYICLLAPAATGTIPETTPTASFTFTKTTTTDAADTASGTLYALTNNGVTKYVRMYIPSAVTGFTEIVRISNTGAVAAPVTITMISESGATIGVPYVTTSFAVGETRRLTQSVIEAAVGGTLASTDRPRLKVTAATNALDVQTLLYTAGVYTSIHGAE